MIKEKAGDDRLRSVFEEGLALHRADDFQGATERYLRVLAERPNLWFVVDNLCQALLAAGDFRAGFALYDNRFHRPRSAVPRPSLPFPEWKGEPLAGKSVLVWPEQGYGDQIMFVRFAQDLREAGADVTLAAYPPLVRLFADVSERVVTASNGSPIPRHDYWVSAASIPGRLALGREQIMRQPYLPRRGGSGSGIGIVVKGDPKHPNDANRSLDRASAQRLLQLPNASSLMPEDTRARDFKETAEIIETLELVISVDTSIAHLSAAMGTPTRLLLPRVGLDWRWMTGLPDNPWYPSIQPFRQAHAGDWSDCIDAVTGAAPIT